MALWVMVRTLLLTLLVSEGLCFSPPSTAWDRATRRNVLAGAGAGALGVPFLGFAPFAASAEYFGEPPPKAKGEEYKEATLKAKDFKVSAPKYAAGEGSDAFKLAEQRRKDVAAGKTLPAAPRPLSSPLRPPSSPTSARARA